MVLLLIKNATKSIALCLIIFYSFKKKFLVKTHKTTCTCEISKDLKQHVRLMPVRQPWQVPHTAVQVALGHSFSQSYLALYALSALKTFFPAVTRELYSTESVLRNDKNTKFYACDTHHSIILTTRIQRWPKRNGWVNHDSAIQWIFCSHSNDVCKIFM